MPQDDVLKPFEPTDESEERLAELRRKRRVFTQPSSGSLAGRRTSSQVLQDISQDLSLAPSALSGAASVPNTIANLFRGITGQPSERPYGYLHGPLRERIERGESAQSLLPVIKQAATGGGGYEFTTTDFQNLAKELEEVIGREAAEKLAREATHREFAEELGGLSGQGLERVTSGKQLPLKSPQEIQKGLRDMGASGSEMFPAMPGRQVPQSGQKPAGKRAETPAFDAPGLEKALVGMEEGVRADDDGSSKADDGGDSRLSKVRERLIDQLSRRAFKEEEGPGILEVLATLLGGFAGGAQGQPGIGLEFAERFSGKKDRRQAEQGLMGVLGQLSREEQTNVKAQAYGGSRKQESPSVEQGRQLRNVKLARSMTPQASRRDVLKTELNSISRNPVMASDPKNQARIAEILRELYAMGEGNE